MPLRSRSPTYWRTCGCLGLNLSWLALVPLLQMLELSSLAVVFTWLLLFVIVAAGGWVAVFAYHLTTASARACLAIPVLGFGLVGFYRLIAARLWPALWPATDAALQFAFIAMCVWNDLRLPYGASRGARQRGGTTPAAGRPSSRAGI